MNIPITSDLGGYQAYWTPVIRLFAGIFTVIAIELFVIVYLLWRFTMKMFLIALAATLLLATPVHAQTAPVTNPTEATFQHIDSEFAKTGSFRLEFFQCQTYAPGPPESCQGRANAPFQTAPYPKALVTTTPPAHVCLILTDCLRHLNLTAPAPGSAAINSMPAGVSFVAVVVAVADPTTGAAGEARSTDSNPFFAKGVSLVSPTNLQIR